jgi:hypothetical protein
MRTLHGEDITKNEKHYEERERPWAAPTRQHCSEMFKTYKVRLCKSLPNAKHHSQGTALLDTMVVLFKPCFR